jgi:hypothetical protein
MLNRHATAPPAPPATAPVAPVAPAPAPAPDMQHYDHVMNMITYGKDLITPLITHITLGVNTATTLLWDRVYSKWNHLPEEVKKFYRTYIRLMAQTSNGGWVALENPDNHNLEKRHLRFNLMKVNSNDPKSNILFASTLPKLNNSDTDNLLESIYQEQYKLSSSTNDICMKEPKKTGFDLHPMKYTQSLLRNAKTRENNPTSIVASNLDKILDMVTGQVYTRNQKGELLKDGKNINDDTLYDASCGGTGLLTNKSDDCFDLLDCLLNNNRDLDSCLNVLSNRNTFITGRDAAKLAHPYVLKALLTKLNKQCTL